MPFKNPRKMALEPALVRALGGAFDRACRHDGGTASRRSVGAWHNSLGLTFVDADAEIEAAAGMTIAEIFHSQGKPYSRSGEQRVIARLLEKQPAGPGDRRRHPYV